MTLGYFWEEVDIDARICLSPCLVLPIARNEAPTLEHFFKLLRTEQFKIVLREKVRFCRAVANGLSELHRAGVVHGDLKLGNVLLFGDPVNASGLTPKITDFSHSFVMSDYSKTSRRRPLYTGTRPFTIPEIRKQDKFADVLADDDSSEELPVAMELEDFYSCDVFSLGLLICAILNDGIDLVARIREHSRRRGLEPNDLLTEAILDQLCDHPSGLMMECKRSLRARVPSLGMALDGNLSAVVEKSLEICLQEDPRQRSSADAVVRNFDTWLGDDNDAPQNR
jgi:serine/threonine protein kinase